MLGINRILFSLVTLELLSGVFTLEVAVVSGQSQKPLPLKIAGPVNTITGSLVIPVEVQLTPGRRLPIPSDLVLKVSLPQKNVNGTESSPIGPPAHGEQLPPVNEITENETIINQGTTVGETTSAEHTTEVNQTNVNIANEHSALNENFVSLASTHQTLLPKETTTLPPPIKEQHIPTEINSNILNNENQHQVINQVSTISNQSSSQATQSSSSNNSSFQNTETSFTSSANLGGDSVVNNQVSNSISSNQASQTASSNEASNSISNQQISDSMSNNQILGGVVSTESQNSSSTSAASSSSSSFNAANSTSSTSTINTIQTNQELPHIPNQQVPIQEPSQIPNQQVPIQELPHIPNQQVPIDPSLNVTFTAHLSNGTTIQLPYSTTIPPGAGIQDASKIIPSLGMEQISHAANVQVPNAVAEPAVSLIGPTNVPIFGVEFTPYIRSVNVSFSNYTLEDVKAMLRVIQTRHHSIQTRELSQVQSTFESSPALLIAPAAAQINQEYRNLTLSVLQGCRVLEAPAGRQLFNNLMNTAASGVSGAVNGIGQVGTGAVNLASNGLNTVGSGVSGAVNLAENGLNKAANIVEQGVVDTVDTVSNGRLPPRIITPLLDRGPQPADHQPDCDAAFQTIQNANSIFPGTVWGLVLGLPNGFIGHVEDFKSGRIVLNQASRLLDRAHNSSLRLGASVDICTDIYGSDVGKRALLIDLAKTVDFFICSIYPQAPVVSVQDYFQNMTSMYAKIRESFNPLVPSLEIYLQTGVASEGVSKRNPGSPVEFNTVQKMAEFWNRVDVWSRENQVRVFMHEAFDTPDEPYDQHSGYFKMTQDGSNRFVDKSTGQIVKF